MKHLQKNIRRIAILLCALFVLLASYGAYSISTYGNRWFASSANTFARAKKKDVIAGINILRECLFNGHALWKNADCLIGFEVQCETECLLFGVCGKGADDAFAVFVVANNDLCPVVSGRELFCFQISHISFLSENEM